MVRSAQSKILAIVVVAGGIGLSAGPSLAVTADYGAYIYSNITVGGNVVNYTTPPGDSIFTGVTSDTHAANGDDGASVTASADLATGQIKVFDYLGFTQVSLTDTLYLDVTGLTDPFDILFDISVDGTFGDFSQQGFSFLLLEQTGAQDQPFCRPAGLAPTATARPIPTRSISPPRSATTPSSGRIGLPARSRSTQASTPHRRSCQFLFLICSPRPVMSWDPQISAIRSD
jgi:hypothetical protein